MQRPDLHRAVVNSKTPLARRCLCARKISGMLCGPGAEDVLLCSNHGPRLIALRGLYFDSRGFSDERQQASYATQIDDI